MKYSVYYNNNVESNKVAEFDSLEEAKAYCAKNTEGCDEYIIAIPEDISSDIYNSLKNDDK